MRLWEKQRNAYQWPFASAILISPAGFRDRLIHDYLNVDLTLVWQTAKYTVVDLLIEVETLLDNLRKLEE
ncbi:HepT-like ribonuclease domain-containing protein [Spirosoma sp. KCTC 42546]|uniref:HepT-like ribonuclease domain-containing protein n=1 Tax=Spirosoma sp. KCTC 42546 TaxID=2520506 RepID=UPI00352D386E